MGQGFQKIHPQRTTRNTDAHDRKHYQAAFGVVVIIASTGWAKKLGCL